MKDFYGITITNIFDEDLESKLSAIKHAHNKIIARVVVDKLDDYTPYINALKLISNWVTPMLQICDSSLDKNLTDEEYDAREMWMLENLSEYCPYVEIANEVGPTVDWTSGKQLERARVSSDRWFGHQRVITLFWDARKSMSDYIEQYLSDIPKEYVMVSFYPHKIEDFSRLYPGIMLSECGMNEWHGKYSKKMEAVVKRKAYKIGPPVMWWNWQG